jgi:tetratricopeptide (TPR) repeat protein
MKTFTILLAVMLIISTGYTQRRNNGNIRGDDSGRIDRVDKKRDIEPVSPPVVYNNPPVYTPQEPIYNPPTCYVPEPVLVEVIEVYPDPDRIDLNPDESTIIDSKLYLTPKESAISNFNNEEYLTAINELTAAINEDPFDQELFLYMGRCHIGLNEYEDAIKQITTAIKIDSLYDEAFYFRGLSKYYLGKREEAALDLIAARSLGNEKAASILKKYFHI